MGHGTVRIGGQRAVETDHRLGMVEAEGPVQAAVEPNLRVRRGRRDRAAIAAQIIAIVHPLPLSRPHPLWMDI